MANFDSIIPWLLYIEDSHGEPGKIVDLGDGAGLTRLGLTQRWHPNLPADFFTTMEFADAVKTAKPVYKQNEWRAINGDQINSDPVAAMLFSFSVNDNPVTAVKVMQALLSIKEDGYIGPNTIAELNSKDPAIVERLFRADWISFYQHLVTLVPEKKPFLAGWINRANFSFPAPAQFAETIQKLYT